MPDLAATVISRRELGEELGALLVLLALAEHDVLELGMTGHGGVRFFCICVGKRALK